MTSYRAFGDAALDRGLHLGDGVFETILVARGRACFLADHLARLDASCRALGIPRPLDLEEGVVEHLPDLLAEERRPERAVLRITVTRGPWRGLDPVEDAGAGVYLVLRALPEAPAALDATVVDAVRIDPRCPLAGHKTVARMLHVEARRRARAARADVALLPTIDGDVAEADAANLFVVLGDEVVTPPLDRGILPGITRARVLRMLRDGGRPATERRVTAEDLARADEVFLTASLAGITPVRRLGGRRLPPAGPVTSRLASRVPPEEDAPDALAP